MTYSCNNEKIKKIKKSGGFLSLKIKKLLTLVKFLPIIYYKFIHFFLNFFLYTSSFYLIHLRKLTFGARFMLNRQSFKSSCFFI